jgi:hypothetical protein
MMPKAQTRFSWDKSFGLTGSLCVGLVMFDRRKLRVLINGLRYRQTSKNSLSALLFYFAV